MEDKVSTKGREQRKGWTDEELILSLGYYVFIYQDNTRTKDLESFTNDLNSVTSMNRGWKAIKIRFGNYDSLNPRKENGGYKNGGKRCFDIWKEFISLEGYPKNALFDLFFDFVTKHTNKSSIYSSFLTDYKRHCLDVDDENGIINSYSIPEGHFFKPFKAKPMQPPKFISGSKNTYERNNAFAKQVLYDSNFCCNIDSSHKSFYTKNKKQYMEAHHLIPMFAQKNFPDVSIDVPANIICLCPNCHRKLHYGVDIEKDLRQLYDSRIDVLRQFGINITFEELLDYYK